MALKDDLTKEVAGIFETQWEVQDAASVPEPKDLRLNSNHAKRLGAVTVLYADLGGSTNMVDSRPWEFSAEVYKAFLRCTSQIIKNATGTITAYDGDRVMAVFTGDSKNTNAVRCALKINWAMKNIAQPSINKQYKTDYVLKHVVGVDTSEVRAARVGVHGDNDLVWIGRAPNYAAKLTSESEFPTWIMKSVYDGMHQSVKFSGDKDIWQARSWPAMNNAHIYGTSYWIEM